MQKFHVCIVIPCYNESRNFRLEDYTNFLKNQQDTLLCFVNDGSKDGTLDILNTLKSKFLLQIEIVNLEQNSGKAEAVRTGVLHSNTNFNFEHIAYLDADLAVSLEECYSLKSHLKNNIAFAFGSRILKVGSVIERKRSRFLVGRFIATIISEILSIKVYDTQCGCKMMTKELASKIFEEKFISKWLFDVELFFRILKLYGKEKALTKMLEIPLTQWIDRGESKVKTSYFFKLWVDLYKIKRVYK